MKYQKALGDPATKSGKIFVLEDGELVESGTHMELEDEIGHYKEFVKHQLLN